MNEETKTMEIYCYVIDGKELWTSNATFAKVRANTFGSKVYVEVIEIQE